MELEVILFDKRSDPSFSYLFLARSHRIDDLREYIYYYPHGRTPLFQLFDHPFSFHSSWYVESVNMALYCVKSVVYFREERRIRRCWLRKEEYKPILEVAYNVNASIQIQKVCSSFISYCS